jgi:hypothetical protein
VRGRLLLSCPCSILLFLLDSCHRSSVRVYRSDAWLKDKTQKPQPCCRSLARPLPLTFLIISRESVHAIPETAKPMSANTNLYYGSHSRSCRVIRLYLQLTLIPCLLPQLLVSAFARTHFSACFFLDLFLRKLREVEGSRVGSRFSSGRAYRQFPKRRNPCPLIQIYIKVHTAVPAE